MFLVVAVFTEQFKVIKGCQHRRISNVLRVDIPPMMHDDTDINDAPHPATLAQAAD